MATLFAETNCSLTSEFITAGRAIFTVSSPSGDHYTYRITKKEASGNYQDAWFASLLTGPDNTSDYTYMGVLDAQSLTVRTTMKSSYSKESKPVIVLNWALSIIKGERRLPDGYELHHESRCGRCGRSLTTPRSCRIGLGPECEKMME